MVLNPTLPKHPRVVVDGTTIVIQYENGEKEVWGHEPNQETAQEVARKIELGLKAINYVALELMKSLTDIADQLEGFGIPPENINDHICEGYGRVSKWFRKTEFKPLEKEV